MKKRILSILLSVIVTAMLFSSCSDVQSDIQIDKNEKTAAPAAVTNLSKPDSSKWHYIKENDIYYQAEIDYCEKPSKEQYEQLAIFVPGAYMNATDNGDDTFTCELNKDAQQKDYTALNAPIAMQIYTPGYAAADALTYEFVTQNKAFSEEIAEMTSQGIIYVCPGCRGIKEGAPAGVTDLKAAIRYLRYTDDVIPGSAESIVVFGMSGGGAQAAILGASGDSKLYDPYLKEIGAVQGVSDSVKGVMAWCPVTNLKTANAEYEWMMGCSRKNRTKEENALSDALAIAYAEYVNKAGFTDENGKALTLTQSEEGIFQSGSYYEYVKSVIETSLDHYLSDKNLEGSSAQEYIDSLNKDKKWITYDKNTNTASITSIADFVNNCKKASETLVAFDWPHSYNTLFGYGDGKGAHFDCILGDVLTQMNSEFAGEYIEDFKKTDSFGSSVKQRVNMYSPLYYLMESEEGYRSANVAPYWRIRTGIQQNTNSSTTEINLSLALKNYSDIETVDFETVWEQGHEPVERSGNSNENFIAWIKEYIK